MLSLFYNSLFYQIFSDLYCVKCGTFLNLVAYQPQGQTVFVCQILTNTTNIYIVFSGKEQWHWICLCFWIVHKLNAFALSNCILCFFYRNWFFSFNPNCFGVR